MNGALSKTTIALIALFAAACLEDSRAHGHHRAAFDRAAVSAWLAPAANPQHIGSARFGNSIEYIGFDIDPPRATIGQAAHVTLYFRCLEEVNADYRIFVHLDDPTGRLDRIHADHDPAGGNYHTDVWRKGDVVKDTFSFTPTPGLTALDFWLGFYLGDDRLPVGTLAGVRTDGLNRVLAATLPVQ